MKVLNYQGLGKSLEATREICQMVRILTGVQFAKGIPIDVLDVGREREVYKAITKTIEYVDENGNRLEDADSPRVSKWIEKLEALPLRLRQGKEKVSIDWASINTFTYDDKVEDEYEEKVAKEADTKTKQTKALLGKLAKVDEEKLAKILELLNC